ncbi:hypothetical protein GRX03_14540 [Halovenus sp. WSH3]|uniref:Uncharacterized protein n=1 Tax=Halovenus carboxidivorans TaxID=2692199 RepID=A0A6B0THY8_9EURY|nr:hypothetical protein [Halovenus carboxidivorans]MXR52819.1 hypothetical protein [Halovenus carboxidivorans]
MDCAAFFEAAGGQLGETVAEPSQQTAGGQCVYEFYHPRVRDHLGTEGLATSFNRSGVVWVPTGRQFAVTLRVPERYGEAVEEALDPAPLAFERTDHRGVSAPDGEMLTVLHFSLRSGGVSEEDVRGTLSALGTAAAV